MKAICLSPFGHDKLVELKKGWGYNTEAGKIYNVKYSYTNSDGDIYLEVHDLIFNDFIERSKADRFKIISQ